MTMLIFLYTMTAPINGFSGGALYSRIGGRSSFFLVHIYCLSFSLVLRLDPAE